MPQTKLTAKRITTFLQNLEGLVGALPTRERKEELERELAAVITFLEEFKARLAKLPAREEEAGLEESLRALSDFVRVAEADPLLSKTLGLTSRRPKARAGSQRRSTSSDHFAIVEHLKGLSPDEMRATLNQRSNGWTVADLKQVASLMGVRVRSKTPRASIVEQIVKRAENQAGYDYLRKHA